MTLRQILLIVALAATLAAVWLSDDVDNDVDNDVGDDESSVAVVEAAPRKAAPVSGAPMSPPPGKAVAAVAARFAAGGPDLFPLQSWKPQPAPAPVVVAPPPPPPQAPPVPFKYVGRWDADDGATLFLAQGEQVVTLRVGQALAQWRLDSINANGMNFTYLPLQQQRQLRFGP